MKYRPSSLAIILQCTAISFCVAANAAPDAPPVAKAPPTAEEIVGFLKTATSPKDQSRFLDLIQKAIQEKKIDWLLIAVATPDMRLRMQVLHRCAHLPKADAAQFWSGMLSEEQWQKATDGLNRDDQRSFQIMAETQVEKVAGKRPKGDFSKAEFRAEMRPQLQAGASR
jgi:hypothetical protein